MESEEITAALAGVDLNLLVVLDALLHERGVTSAGSRLGLTQSATSAALARLRTLFSDPLLVRAGREMHPTPLAESLQRPVREALLSVERVVRSPRSFDPRRDGRTFTIAATDYVVLVLLPALLARLGDTAPGVALRIVATGSDTPVRLERGELDLSISSSFFSGTFALPSRTLFRDRFVAATWRGAEPAGGRLTEEAVRERPYLRVQVGELLPMVERRLAENGLTLHPVASVDSFTTAAHLMTGTRMVAFLQRRAALCLKERAELAVVEVPFELPGLAETLFWHPRAEADAGHAWLRAQIIAVAGALGG
jgi:DNA-binding transcriptional LysR family regulator